jgi:hypothetical protein
VTAHIDDGELLLFCDAALAEHDDRRVADHLEGCPRCRARFEAHSDLEAAVATTAPMPRVLRARARELTEHVLNRRPHLSARTVWCVLLAGAAALLVLALSRFETTVDFAVDVNRVRVPDVTRAGGEERLHLDVIVGEPAFLIVFARRADGSVRRILPDPDPTLGDLLVEQPLPAGRVTRVPGNELFDVAIDPAAPFVEFVLVRTADRAHDAELRRLERLIAAAPVGSLPAELAAARPRCRVVAVPGY